MPTWNARSVLLLGVVICFALRAIGLDVVVNLVGLGLAFGFVAFPPGDRPLPVS